MARMAAMKKVLSPISVATTIITECMTALRKCPSWAARPSHRRSSRRRRRRLAASGASR